MSGFLGMLDALKNIEESVLHPIVHLLPGIQRRVLGRGQYFQTEPLAKQSLPGYTGRTRNRFNSHTGSTGYQIEIKSNQIIYHLIFSLKR